MAISELDRRALQEAAQRALELRAQDLSVPGLFHAAHDLILDGDELTAEAVETAARNQVVTRANARQISA